MNKTKTASLVLTTILLTGCTGGGETVVSGMGNSGNYFGLNAHEEILAQQLAQSSVVPEVTDGDLRAVFEQIRSQALEGDLQSALVLYRLAARQRAVAEE